MFECAKNASFDYAIKCVSSDSKQYTSIRTNTLIYKASGSTAYHQGGNHLATSPGKVLFIPAGASFATDILEPGEYIEVKFKSIVEPSPEIVLFSDFNAKEMERIFRDIHLHCSQNDVGSYFHCQMQLNKIFLLLVQHRESELSISEYQQISPALEYMRKNLFSSSFSIGEMVKCVTISDTYFRKLFAKQFGMSPQRYVVSERILLAKRIFRDNPYSSVHFVAEAVGYSDVFYFSRIFKRETGVSPTNFSKKYQAQTGTHLVTSIDTSI